MTNCVSVMTKILRFSSPFIHIECDHGKRHAMRAHKPQAVSDWLNPHSLGAMSGFGCIDNLA